MIKNEPNHRSNETLIEGFKTTKINSSTKGPACRQAGMVKYQLINIDLNR